MAAQLAACIKSPACVGLLQPACTSLPAELKSSVSFEAARRALSEAKAHCKAKAAAVLLASNKTWQEKLAAVKDEKQQLVRELQELKQHQQVRCLADHLKSTAGVHNDLLQVATHGVVLCCNMCIMNKSLGLCCGCCC